MHFRLNCCAAPGPEWLDYAEQLPGVRREPLYADKSFCDTARVLRMTCYLVAWLATERQMDARTVSKRK